MESITNNINPDHYTKECSLECIESMELIFGEKAVLDFCICNAWKYIWRHKNKNGDEDLEKAKWYLEYAFEHCADINRMIDRMLNYIEQHIESEE